MENMPSESQMWFSINFMSGVFSSKILTSVYIINLQYYICEHGASDCGAGLPSGRIFSLSFSFSQTKMPLHLLA